MKLLPVLLLFALNADAAPLAKRRFALVVGANDGVAKRPLRYAVSDANAFGQLMRAMGGIATDDAKILSNPDPTEMRAAVSALKSQIESAHANGAQVELVFFYSGHADDRGLLLHAGQLPFQELHGLLGDLPTDFTIAILDACASGAFTRTKGGDRVAGFLVDASSTVRGKAVLTSSAETEVSQESDALRSSFFTHHLLSGLRGAADVSRDGKVTLNEAYQFAFDETLARTENTAAGAQHPAYDMAISGTGDVVLTDLRSTDALLSLPQGVSGQVFVRDQAGQLVVEVNKRAGRQLELGLEGGNYSVTMESGDKHFKSDISLKPGSKLELTGDSWTEVAAVTHATRGVDRTDVKSWRARVSLGLPVNVMFGQPAFPDLVGVGFAGRVDATYFVDRLVDDAQTPFGALQFLQHPTSVRASVTIPSLTTELSTQVFPWERTGLEANATLFQPIVAQQVGLGFGAGVLHYFTPRFSMGARYAGSRAIGAIDLATYVDDTAPIRAYSSSSDEATVHADWLIANLALLSLEGGPHFSRGDVWGSTNTLGNPIGPSILARITGTAFVNRRLSLSAGFDFLRAVYAPTYAPKLVSAQTIVSSQVSYFFTPSIQAILATQWYRGYQLIPKTEPQVFDSLTFTLSASMAF